MKNNNKKVYVFLFKNIFCIFLCTFFYKFILLQIAAEENEDVRIFLNIWAWFVVFFFTVFYDKFVYIHFFCRIVEKYKKEEKKKKKK